MTALLILLTPVLLLAIVGLFGFVGCGYPNPNSNPIPAVETAASGTSTISATVANLHGGELLVAAVQWGGSSQSPTVVTDSGVKLNPAPEVNNGSAFDWNGMKIQVFAGVNSSSDTVKVLAVLAAPSTVSWNLCVWPYVTKTPNLYGTVSSDPNATGTEIAATTQIDVMNTGDVVYAVAYAADSDGKFPSNNQLSVGMGFTAASTSIADPLLESLVTTSSGLVIAQATNRTGSSNSKAFILAAAVKIT